MNLKEYKELLERKVKRFRKLKNNKKNIQEEFAYFLGQEEAYLNCLNWIDEVKN